MGFYDCRCMVTGVSLKGADAALVLLHTAAGEYAPISLAIKGNYNRLGAIDGIDEDANVRLVLHFFLDGLRSGAVQVDAEYLTSRGYFPIWTIGHLLHGCERNMNDGAGRVVLCGESVVFALVACAVSDTIAQATPPSGEPVPVVFQRLFGVNSVGSAIYTEALEEVAEQVGEFAAVDAFLRHRGLRWLPSEAAGQDYPEEMQQYLTEARQRFADSALITAALRRYEEEVAALLEGE